MTTLREALRLLETRELTTVDLTEAVIARIEATEPHIHAWVSAAIDEARIAAVRADELRGRTAEIPPLLGIPVGIKDIFDIAGQPTRCNSRLFDAVAPATRTAWSVTSLLRDGVTVLGKTVTQEFAAGVVSPPARNPWDPARIPGGSSGGSAAAVAAGACTFALGTDTGGSIRIPASLTGTVGLKPTWGTIPLRGVFPLSTSLDTVGPIARTVADAMIAWQSLRRQGERIAGTIAALEATRSLAGRRIGLLGGHFARRVQPDVLAATETAASVFASLGAEVVPVAWLDAATARATGLMIQRVEAAAVHATALRESAELMGEDLRSRLEVGSLMSGVDYIDALKAREAVKASIKALYRDGQFDAVVAPSTAATAPRADAAGIPFDDGTTEAFGVAMTRLTTPWNATGQPVIALPSGVDRDGLPIGLSVIGRPYDEMTIAAIAHAYEQAAGWHLRRPELQAPCRPVCDTGLTQ